MSEILLIKKEEGLTKQQIAFNKLVKSIETKSQQLTLLESNIRKYNTQKDGALADLQQQYVDIKLAYATILDNAYENNKFSKKDAQKLIQIIINICSCTIEDFSGTFDNTELTSIVEKYQKLQTQALSSQDQAFSKDLMQIMMKEQYGFDIDLSDLDSFDFDKIKDRFTTAFEQSEAKSRDASSTNRKNKHTTNSGSEKDKVAADKMNKSWKSIYLNLVKKFHPDTEQDELKKAEMDSVLKEITTAYDANNFYKLLELDIKYASQAGIETKDENIVSEYIKILKKQEIDIKDKLAQLNYYISSSRLTFLKNKQADGYIHAKLIQLAIEMQNEIELLKHESNKFSDINYLKTEIKKIKLEDIQHDFSDDFDF